MHLYIKLLLLFLASALVYFLLRLYVFVPDPSPPTAFPSPPAAFPSPPAAFPSPPAVENNENSNLMSIVLSTVVTTCIIVLVTMFVTKGSDKIAELFKKKSNKDDKAFKAKKGRLGSTVEVEKALKFLQSEIDKAEKMRNKVKGLEELEQLYMRAELEMALVSENLGRNKETYLLRYEKLIEDLGKKQEERERDTKKSSRIISDT